MTLLVLKKK